MWDECSYGEGAEEEEEHDGDDTLASMPLVVEERVAARAMFFLPTYSFTFALFNLNALFFLSFFVLGGIRTARW